ncbi:sigma factor-binding protein Crl [Vibrio aestuarianus]|uniref:sigma factor-binding protein Crl n=1 Tax=Vibrio aestuarianus TaxID=28171 RepID=UPI00237CEFBB|nr:sigma factor-binding protein Crl [Vibrio aestuarianus]MDE1221054.1 sigma factor-binding protein Crl [Vibrio aestuarianus]MDE1334765.1 sigma factor-binding protein Crl [Vibrio aestuarianus]
MSEMSQAPTHYRLLAALKAIGPYLREGQCREEHYLFDCLSACVNDKKSPEKREFWGWWLELTKTESGFDAKYHAGRYNLAGTWDADTIPKSAQSEVKRTQEEFHAKLVSTLYERFELTVEITEDSAEFA